MFAIVPAHFSIVPAHFASNSNFTFVLPYIFSLLPAVPLLPSPLSRQGRVEVPPRGGPSSPHFPPSHRGGQEGVPQVGHVI